MIKVWVYPNERYPDFQLYEEDLSAYDGPIEITENELKQYQAARDAYDAAQNMISEKIDDYYRRRAAETVQG